MFDLDHFLDENNWIKESWWGNWIYYQFDHKKDNCVWLNARIFITSKGFESLLFRDDLEFKNKFLIMIEGDVDDISHITDMSLNFSTIQIAEQALKQKLNQIQERTSIFTKEDMPCLI